ncbi:MAG: hypothetical protein WB952_25390 [Terriglobales bacterium]
MAYRTQAATAALLLMGLAGIVSATSKPHVILFGNWTTIKLLLGREENETLDLKAGHSTSMPSFANTPSAFRTKSLTASSLCVESFG